MNSGPAITEYLLPRHEPYYKKMIASDLCDAAACRQQETDSEDYTYA